jgi:hypothetical protein
MFLLGANKNNGEHHEITVGGLVVVPGKGEVAVTMFDPLSDALTGGVGWFSTTATAPGMRSRSYQVFGNPGTFNPNTFGKAAGLGDLEALCDPAPIEIGNFVWNDLNHNGIQDANELGIAGVTVQLYSNPDGILNNFDDLPLLPLAVTNAAGQYFFNTGKNGLMPNTHYVVAINPVQPALTGLPTIPKTGSKPAIDSDGVSLIGGPLGGLVVAGLTTGSPGDNDHRYDFGFFLSACDTDLDGDIDKLDLSAISRARGTTPLPGDPRDANGDGAISPADVKVCLPKCTRANCATQ